MYDTHGEGARPIGVIEPEYLVRVNDAVGDWLNISFDGGVGWMLYKAKSAQVMYPALTEKPNFWDNLVPFHEPVFYHVRFELPEKVEIKVRYAPYSKAEVCGALKRGMVVSCGAILDNTWLEIRFNRIDAAWVLMDSASGVQLMKEVDRSLQNSFSNTLKSSPTQMTVEDLLPIVKADVNNDEGVDHEMISRPTSAASIASSVPHSEDELPA